MIEILKSKTTLTPETDLQELWQLSGRVEALVALCEREQDTGFHSIDVDIVLAVLGYAKAEE